MTGFPKRLPSGTTVTTTEAAQLLGVSFGVATAIMLAIGFHNVGRKPRDMFVLSESFVFWGKGRAFPDFVPRSAWGERAQSVYFVGCNSDRVKIGFSARPDRRLGEIRTGCPYEVSLVAVMRASKPTEAALHHWFREYRTSGEWFRREGALAELLEKAPQ